MTRLSLTSCQCPVAMLFALAIGALATAQAAPYGQQQYTQPAARLGQYQTYQQQVTVPPVQPQSSPYTTTAQQPAMHVAQSTSQYNHPQYQPYQQPYQQTQVPRVEPQFQPQPRPQAYQLPDYQAPAPGERYAMMAETPHSASEPVPAPPALDASPAYAPATKAMGAADWEGYVQAPTASYGAASGDCGCKNGECSTGDCYTEGCDYGAFGGGSQLLGDRLSGACCPRQWFFGAYSLYMTRDNPSYHKFAHLIDSPASYPYYPSQSETLLSTDDIEPDWQWGAEIRFGSTLGRPRGCGPCGGAGARPYAWEVVYWGLAEDDQTAIVTDVWSDTDRIYSAINYAGIQYDRDGATGGTWADRPVNDYFDYDMPINDPTVDTNDVRILGLRARSNFSTQNLELNFIRFPVAGCNTNPCCPSRFSVNGVCGLRYMKLDDDLQYAAMFTTVDGTGNPNAGEPTAYTSFPSDDDNNIFHDVNVDNELVGFQLGGNMNWLIGCKWSAFCDTQFGIYGNRIDSRQRVWGGGGGEVTWVASGNEVDVRSSKTDVSFLTEMRAGLGYQIGCNCRITTAYRLIAITGVALSGEQIPTDWSSPDYVGIIDSNDSLILHGLQTGVEWKY